MEVFITTEGTPQIVADKLFAAADQGTQTMGVMTEILMDMLRVNALNFSSKGRYGGGSWAALKASTIKKKGTNIILRTIGAKAKYHPFGPDALYKSVTKLGAPFQILELGNDRVAIGTDRPAAGVHMEGAPTRNIPKRPFLTVLPKDINKWNDMITRHLMSAFLGINHEAVMKAYFG